LQENVENILDLRGTILPVAMLEFAKAFSEMKQDGIMEILLGDQETKEDLFKVLRAYPYELLDVAENDSLYRVTLRKGRKGNSGETEGRG
jgi:TusA-related sulfurtransferase